MKQSFKAISEVAKKLSYQPEVLDDELKNAVTVIMNRCKVDPHPYCVMNKKDISLNPTQFDFCRIEVEDIITFPKWEEIQIFCQEISPNSRAKNYFLGVTKNDLKSWIDIRDLRYIPRVNKQCVSYLQKRLSEMNPLDAVKHLSGKTVKCLYKSIDFVPVFNENGTRKMELTKVINGVPFVQQVYRTKLVPFLTFK